MREDLLPGMTVTVQGVCQKAITCLTIPALLMHVSSFLYGDDAKMNKC